MADNQVDDKNVKDFIDYLKNFLEFLHKYSETESTKRYLDEFLKLRFNRLVRGFIVGANVQPLNNDNSTIAQLIQNFDERLFDKTLYSKEFSEKGVKLIPGIDLSYHWDAIPSAKRSKMWKFLQLLHLLSDLIRRKHNQTIDSKERDEKTDTANKIMAAVNTSESASQSSSFQGESEITSLGQDNSTVQTSEFNPYEGVGSGKSIGVNDLIGGPSNLPENPEEGDGGGLFGKLGGLGNIANMAGMAGMNGGVPGMNLLNQATGLSGMLSGQMGDLSNMQEELKNISQDDIKEAAESIRGILGSQFGGEHSNLLNEMLNTITDELQTTNLAENSNPMAGIMQIAENVANKVKPNISEEDMENLVYNTTSTAQQYNNDLLSNPQMMTQILSQMTGQNNQDANAPEKKE